MGGWWCPMGFPSVVPLAPRGADLPDPRAHLLGNWLQQLLGWVFVWVLFSPCSSAWWLDARAPGETPVLGGLLARGFWHVST